MGVFKDDSIECCRNCMRRLTLLLLSPDECSIRRTRNLTEAIVLLISPKFALNLRESEQSPASFHEMKDFVIPDHFQRIDISGQSESRTIPEFLSAMSS
jgi:hypothetical protein